MVFRTLWTILPEPRLDPENLPAPVRRVTGNLAVRLGISFSKSVLGQESGRHSIEGKDGFSIVSDDGFCAI